MECSATFQRPPQVCTADAAGGKLKFPRDHAREATFERDGGLNERTQIGALELRLNAIRRLGQQVGSQRALHHASLKLGLDLAKGEFSAFEFCSGTEAAQAPRRHHHHAHATYPLGPTSAPRRFPLSRPAAGCTVSPESLETARPR